jgi:hypothetical protein
MPSTREPILLLEPSNLLEPLNLEDRYVDPANSSDRPEIEGTSSRKFMRPVRRDSISASAAISRDSSRDRSWRLKSALLVAGAFACFAAGVALPQLPELAFGDAKTAQQTKPAQQPQPKSAQQTNPAQQAVTEAVKPSAPVADAPAKSEDSKAAESKPSETTGSNQSVALTANPGTQSTVTGPAAPAAQEAAPPVKDARAATPCGPRNRASDDKCLEGGVPEPAAGTARTAVPDRNSDGASATSRTTGASPTKPRAAPQTIWELDDRAQQSVNRRTTQRDAADQPAAADNNASTRSSDRSSYSTERNSWDRDRRQDPDSNRASSRRRERSGDNGQTARYGDSRQEQDVNRSSNWRRDRQDDDYARGDDRRVFGRAPREDDRVIGSGPRHMGPIPIFPSLFGW